MGYAAILFAFYDDLHLVSSDLAPKVDRECLHSVHEITVLLRFRGGFLDWVSAMVPSAAAPFVWTLTASVGRLSSELGEDMGGLIEGREPARLDDQL